MPLSPRFLGVFLLSFISYPLTLAALTPTSVAITASPSTPTLGNLVTLTATVTPAATGTVTFYDGVTVLGTRALSGNVAVFAMPTTVTGTRSFTAHYSGDANNLGSNSSVVHRTISAVLSFGFTTTYQPALAASAAAVGDFNNDGKLDIVSAFGGTLTVSLGNGSGGFGTPNTTEVPTTRSIAVADLNGDGKLDVVIFHFDAPNQFLRILLGNGDGTFTTGADYAIDDSPMFPRASPVVIADFNRDGKPDLAVIHSSTSSIDIMMGNGDGTFAAPIGYPVGTGITDPGVGVTLLTAGDFNGDGKPDLLSYSQAYDTQTLSVLLGNGDGTFAAALTYPASLPPSVNFDSMVVGDLNGDGKLDLAAATWGDAKTAVNVYLGHGDGTFAPPVVYPGLALHPDFDAVISNAFGIGIVDLNGDGKADVVVARYGFEPAVVLFLPGNGDGTLRPEAVFSVPVSVSAMVLAEFDGDGRIDLVLPTFGSSLAVLHGAVTPFLKVTLAHAGDFRAEQFDATYTIQVSNAGGAATTSDSVTVANSLDPSLGLGPMTGPGWTCDPAGPCSRNDPLAPNSSYPPITVTTVVPNSPPSVVTNEAAVFGGGSPFTYGTDTVNVLPYPANCTYALDTGTLDAGAGPIPVAIGAAGGVFTLVITTQPGCIWGADPAAQWVTYSPRLTMGSGQLTYTVAPNSSATSRTTFLFVPDRPLYILQAGTSCTFQLSATATAVASQGGSGSIGITTPTGCAWAPVSNAPWLTVSGSPGSGIGVVNYSAAANTTAQRAGTLMVGGQVFTVTQAPSGGGTGPPACTFTFDPSSVSIPPEGGSLSQTITTQAGCPWQVTSADAWVSITSPASGTGSGTVNYSWAINPSPGSRSTMLSVSSTNAPAGSITITQAGNTCTFQWTLTSAPADALGGAYSIGVVAPQGCPWSVSADAAWLTVTSGNPGNGNGIVGYSVAANPVARQRSGFLNLFGRLFSITQNPAVATSTHFVPITPCRVADTRNANGPFGGPVIAANTSRDFIVPSSACNIPLTASAYSLNVAVVPNGPLGYLTLWPAGQSQPLVATLNSDGRIKSNAAIVPAGTNGAISAFATNPTDLVIDINGYFVPSSDPAALAFFPLTPCRVADTRDPNGPLAGPGLSGQSTRSFPIRESGCNIPGEAQAYVLNFAAVPRAPLGYLTVWPSGQNQPLAASLNALTGTVTANAVLVPGGDNGAVSVFASDPTDLVIDISGYFAPLAEGGLAFYNLPPCRVSDSRNPAGSAPASGVMVVSIATSPCGAPTGALAYVFNATVVPPGPFGYLTMWPSGQPQPLAATLNAVDGAITSNLAIIPTSTDSISLFLSDPTHVVLDVFGYFGPEIPVGP